jgi:hypothetical protein
MSSSEDDIREIPNLLEKNVPCESILNRVTNNDSVSLKNISKSKPVSSSK